MVQAYAIENLRAGMRVGRDVLSENGEVLLSKGQILTRESICSLLERPIYSIYVDEDAEVVDIPGKEHLLDAGYVACYERAHERVKRLLLNLAAEGRLDRGLLDVIVADINHDLAADGAKAISQIHNMERAGAYLFHHSLHVGILAALMGSWLEWDQDRREKLTLAGLLHDVGKLSIDRALLDKTDPLTAEEFAYIKRHTEFGIAMLKNAGENRQEVLNGAAQHHERCDGSGYPQGLEGEQISVIGRIIAFLDIYDAMASDRAFVPRYSPFDAFEAMADDTLSGKLDPVYTVQFMRQTCRALIGTWVELSNGVRGRIVYIPESRIVAKPMIHTVQDEFIDLEVHTDLKVKAILTAAELEA